MAYTDFIPQNVAPLGIQRIDIYDVNGKQVGFIPLGNLTPPNPARKLSGIAIFADIHLNDQLPE